MIKELKKIKFIAEVGMNHNGNFDLSFELIKQAKASGASAVKFQIGWRDKPGELNQIDDKIIKKLIAIAKYFEIEIFFSIINENGFNILKKYKFDTYKVASRTVKENFPLAKKIIGLKKNTIVSLGFWNKKNIPFKKNSKVSYLFCISKYPTYPWEIKKFPKNFTKSIYDGYSDHTVGIDMCILAVSRGAKIIEKHFTLDKSDTSIRDHALSATPDEFKTMVDICEEINKKLQLKI